MTGKPLKVVPPNARRRRPAPTTLLEAVNSGSHRALLVALRKELAVKIQAGVPPHALPPLARQLREIDRAIHDIDAAGGDEVSHAAPVSDEIFDATSI